MNYYQQGDTIYFPTEELPADLVDLKSPVVQEGEATGHAHRLHGDGWTHYENPKTKSRHLRIVTPTALRHEEHQEIILPPGDYDVRIVREYDHFKEEARRVAD